MAFKSEVVLSVITTQAERQIRKVERNIEKIEDASRDILARLTSKSSANGKNSSPSKAPTPKTPTNKIQSLRLQRQELSLQKRELTAINRLEKDRAKQLTSASPWSIRRR